MLFLPLQLFLETIQTGTATQFKHALDMCIKESELRFNCVFFLYYYFF